MILFVAWRDTLNTNSINCNMKKSLWGPNYMPNELGIDLLWKQVFPLQWDGNNLFCWQIQTKTALLLMRTSYAQACAFVLHDVVTITVNRWSLCHLSGQQCPPMERAPVPSHRLLRFQNSAVLSSYSAWIQAMIELRRFCFWLTLRTTPAEKKSHNHQKLFCLTVCFSDNEILCMSLSLATVEKIRTSWSSGCSYHPNSPRSPCHSSMHHRIMES